MGIQKSRAAKLFGTVAAVGLLTVGLSGASASAVDQPDDEGMLVPANSVDSIAVINGSLYSSDLHPAVVKWFTDRSVPSNGVGSTSVKNGSLYAQDLHPDVVKWFTSKTPGPAGPAGAAGAAGKDGAPGKDGVSGYEVIGRGTDSSAVTGMQTVESKCVPGQQVMSGGAKADKPAEVTIHSSFPSDITQVGDKTPENPSGLWAATSWTTTYTNTGTGNVQPFIICVTVN